MSPRATASSRAGLFATVALIVTGTIIASAAFGPGPRPAPSVRFGVIADVQYADRPAQGARRYREALPKLRQAVARLDEEENLDFVVQLGDVIDGGETIAEFRRDLRAVLGVFADLDAPLVHVIGNHCLSVPRPELEARLGLSPTPWRSFVRGAWRFIVLDTMAEPNPEVEYNGGLGAAQRAWLARELAEADAAGQQAILFAHHPLLAEAASAEHLAFDHEAVLELLDEAPAAALWLNGHVHQSGYAYHHGVHHLTLAGMVEAPYGDNALAIVELRPEAVEVLGHGTVRTRTLRLASN